MENDKIYTNKIHDVLELIRKRPYFLTSKSISALENYIRGYMVFGKWGFYDHGLIYNEKDVNLNEFRFWIQGQSYIPLSQGPSCSEFLLDKCNNDEEKAFNLFFKLLDEFKELKRNEID
ncbi:hypothetical protein [uncultured Psychroserpens sp.]|uniref:hypothetical protein n=1 Tax=uncultured Psychroserpens sp. TaxID=255436 RepID=UPI002605437B|nr:hypothetical protein [uncultured Psychroserpens sp.]